jgi:hypothetical protein
VHKKGKDNWGYLDEDGTIILHSVSKKQGQVKCFLEKDKGPLGSIKPRNV